ncbi:MAG: glycosyltransferase family 4 protein [Dissulfurimicrobium sp.]|uniref:glycosyltransferase family 4 protein n=1 Tax=Dissulfurimicrobium sp. TaxID=2022436 RepID=UPI00404B3198
MKPRLKILIDTISLLSPLTGIGRYTYEIARELEQLDNSHEYLYYYGHVSRNLIRPDDQSGAKKIKNLIARHTFVKKAVRKALSVYTGIMTPKADIYWQPNFIPEPGVRARKTIISVHDFSFLHHPAWHPRERIEYFKANFWKQAPQTNRIITGSEYTKHEIIKLLGYDPARIHVIHHGVRHDIFRPLDKAEISNLDLPERYIFAVGSIEPRKNLIGLLKAYNILPRPTKKVYKLVLAGPVGWNNEEIMRMIKKERDNVIYLGYLSDHDLAIAYNLASVFVYPSFYEGFGIPPLEAMACGTPVIASNTSSIPEACGEAALYADPKNSEELADRIWQLLNDSELRQILRSKGFERAGRFSWQRSAAQHLAVFNEVSKDL